MTNFNVINTNTRSLCPKIVSLTDMIDEMNTDLAIVTETWLKDGRELEDLVEKLDLGYGLGMLTRNHRTPASNGVTYGGVAVL